MDLLFSLSLKVVDLFFFLSHKVVDLFPPLSLKVVDLFFFLSHKVVDLLFSLSLKVVDLFSSLSDETTVTQQQKNVVEAKQKLHQGQKIEPVVAVPPLLMKAIRYYMLLMSNSIMTKHFHSTRRKTFY